MLLDSQIQALEVPLDEADVVSVEVDASVADVVHDAIAQLAAIDPAALQHASRASERV